MLFSKIILSTIIAVAFAVPIDELAIFKRHHSGLSSTDTATLILATNLELLELNLWKQGLQNYSADFSSLPNNYAAYTAFHYEQELQHYAALNRLLGGKGPKNCTYVFPGITDAKSFNAMAQVITSVGEAVYLGSGTSITSKALLALASTIIGSEARQNSFLRLAGKLFFYNGLYFDTALTPSQGYSLAAPMIKDCPKTNPKIPFTAKPAVQASLSSKNKNQVDLVYPAAVDTTKSSALIVYQLQTYRAKLTTAADKKSAYFPLPSNANLNGTVFILISTASGTPFPVPDASVQAVGALVIG